MATYIENSNDQKKNCVDDESDSVGAMEKVSPMVSRKARQITSGNVPCACACACALYSLGVKAAQFRPCLLLLGMCFVIPNKDCSSVFHIKLQNNLEMAGTSTDNIST